MLSSRHSFRLVSYREIEKVSSDLVLEKTYQNGEINQVSDVENNDVEIDAKKRSFLKMLGVVGVGAIATSLVPKRADALVFGSTPTSNTVGVKNAANVRVNPALEDGGNLASIKTNTDNLAGIKTDTANLVNIETNTDNLSAIKTAVESSVTTEGFIKTNTDTLVTNSNKFTFESGSLKVVSSSGSGGYEIVGIKDSLDTRINPVQDDTVILLRRMVKIMESQATVDAANRQRITIDAMGALTSMPVTIGAGAAAIGSVVFGATASVNIAGQNQQMYQDPARNAFANGIRQNLIFS
jgi:hypothetical protein